MANVKKYAIGYTTGGTTPHVCVQRASDDFFLNGSGVFVTGAAILNAMTQSFAGFWEYSTSATVWDNGTYNVVIYASSTTAATVLEGYQEVISGDTQVGFIEAASITSKNAVTALRTDLQTLQKTASEQATQIGVLSDRIDSLNAVLSRRDYNSSGP